MSGANTNCIDNRTGILTGLHPLCSPPFQSLSDEFLKLPLRSCHSSIYTLIIICHSCCEFRDSLIWLEEFPQFGPDPIPVSALSTQLRILVLEKLVALAECLSKTSLAPSGIKLST